MAVFRLRTYDRVFGLVCTILTVSTIKQKRLLERRNCMHGLSHVHVHGHGTLFSGIRRRVPLRLKTCALWQTPRTLLKMHSRMHTRFRRPPHSLHLRQLHTVKLLRPTMLLVNDPPLCKFGRREDRAFAHRRPQEPRPRACGNDLDDSPIALHNEAWSPRHARDRNLWRCAGAWNLWNLCHISAKENKKPWIFSNARLEPNAYVRTYTC